MNLFGLTNTVYYLHKPGIYMPIKTRAELDYAIFNNTLLYYCASFGMHPYYIKKLTLLHLYYRGQLTQLQDAYV